MNKTYRTVAPIFVLATALSAVALVALPTSAQAATLVGTSTDFTGIDGLVIDGNTYDVDFVGGSYNSVYSSVQPTFFGNDSGAQAAATAIASALTSLDPAAETQTVNIFIPSSIPFSGDNQGWQPEHNFNMPFFEGTYSQNSSTVFAGPGNSTITAYTEFTEVAPVPLPASWGMMLLGFVGIGFMAFRRKSKPMLMAA